MRKEKSSFNCTAPVIWASILVVVISGERWGAGGPTRAGGGLYLGRKSSSGIGGGGGGSYRFFLNMFHSPNEHVFGRVLRLNRRVNRMMTAIGAISVRLAYKSLTRCLAGGQYPLDLWAFDWGGGAQTAH
jgi:hypothetical protein